MAISGTLKSEAWSSESDLPLVLIEINHSDLTAPIRVVNNTKDITSNGNLFVAFPFEIKLPDSQPEGPPVAELIIDNVSQEIMTAIRTITSAASVTISVVRQSDPDTIEASFSSMRLENVRGNALTVQGVLKFEDLVREPFPIQIFSPADYPALF
ncbi:MAG: DUF1833 domain-containing protein [Nitrosopumilaceae archaeon]|nr:DUF1833 domain-containing protein [Nitrosopumilaceae archaeon]NIU87782.1 DUF1833 domain-containing protein [Nitrosopumilaceae archaeon]NIV65165.1 DUF1833 domain-containing protein [Nitrosopumilaceae archaeon]NIX61680.1 DUF1833 domain-containing protein [Nitrosopumilaceae archaeon]